ncbi:MAG TPA: PrsW family glutamic-type intramembrane protease [Terriglobia bacterium]|nr:PrsW family glutamic-type intramembrane protease [Terriglobia bacterium]
MSTRLDIDLMAQGSAPISITPINLRRAILLGVLTLLPGAVSLPGSTIPATTNQLSGLLSHRDRLMDQHDGHRAFREYRDDVRLNSGSPRAHFDVDLALSREGDWNAARVEYRRAAQLAPHDPAKALHDDRLQSNLSVLPGNWSPALVRAFAISAALVPSFLLLGYFRARDLYPEPARALWATFILGGLAIFPVLLLDWPLAWIVKLFQGALAHGLAEAFFNAALPEELLKFAVVVLFCARLKAFNEPMDGIVYGAVASLGFATLENVGYVTGNGLGVAVSRAFTSVPGHAFMGAVMGYFVGQWRFGLPAGRTTALIKACLAPMSLHWVYDFPLLAYGAANRLAGPARQAAVNGIAPFMVLSVAILVLETIWGVRLVNRLRREQIQFVRDTVAAAAAAEGAMDLVALVRAPDPPPSAWPGWLMTLVGGLLATAGGFISIFVVILFAESSLYRDPAFDFGGGTLVGGIPLLVGMVLFVYGVQRIHASQRRLPPQPLPASRA